MNPNLTTYQVTIHMDDGTEAKKVFPDATSPAHAIRQAMRTAVTRGWAVKMVEVEAT